MCSTLESPAADYVLGETGETVIYIFPDGDALMNRDAETAPASLAQHERQIASTQPTTPTRLSEAALIKRLVAQGQLTEAQVQVGRYDHETTGIALVDALVARGWLSADYAGLVAD